jgi:hypothetical protein
MVGAGAFAKVALKASPAHLTAEKTLEPHPGLGDFINVANHFFAGFIAEDTGFFGVQSAASVGVGFTILSGQQVFIVEIVRAQKARDFPWDIHAHPHALGLGGVTIKLAFTTTSRGLFRDTTRRGEKIRSALNPVKVAVEFAIVFGSRLTAKLTLNVLNIDPDAIGFAVAFLGDTTIIHPLLSCKVDGFGAVVSEVVTGMVPVWICYHKLAFIVHHFVDCDAVLGLEKTGRYEVRLVSKKLIASLCITWPDA